jgi:hypothetical protein
MNCQFQDCGAYAIKGGTLCFTHDPQHKEEHLAAAARGGSASDEIGSIRLEELKLDRPATVIALLQDTINRVRVVREDGSMHIKMANCLGFLSNHLLRAMELSELEQRLETVERVILERKTLIKK